MRPGRKARRPIRASPRRKQMPERAEVPPMWHLFCRKARPKRAIALPC
jgi:hypothetical protein